MSDSAEVLARYFNFRRAIIGVAVLGALLLPAYLLLLDRDDGIDRARLLTTRGGNVGLDDGKLAPDFELPSYNGDSLRLSDLRGRPLLINFWATWCGSCLSEMPEIAALQQDRGADTFGVLAINAGETREQAGKFIDFLGAPFDYGLDADLVVADAYGVYGLPMSVFLDADGIVRAVYRGHADRARLEAFLDAATQSRPPPDLPVQVRTVSTIPRERLLTVSQASDSTVLLRSRSLRCDPSYCAEMAAATLSSVTGVLSTNWAPAETLPSLRVRFNPSVTDVDAIARALAAALEASKDPLYELPVDVRYED